MKSKDLMKMIHQHMSINDQCLTRRPLCFIQGLRFSFPCLDSFFLHGERPRYLHVWRAIIALLFLDL